MSHWAIQNIFYNLKFVSDGKAVAKTWPWFACFCVMTWSSTPDFSCSDLMLYKAQAHFVMLAVCLIQLLLTKLTESVTTIDVTFSQALRVVVMSNYGRLASVEDASLCWSCRKICGDCHIFETKLTWMQTIWTCELLSGLKLRAAGNLKWAYDDDYFFHV